MKNIILFLLALNFYSNIKAQTPIPLREVRVFPEGFAEIIIEKMKTATNKNLHKDFVNCNIFVESLKNNSEITVKINQTGKFQLEGLHNKNYKFEDLVGEHFYDDVFFKKYDFGNLLKNLAFTGKLIGIFELDNYKFLNKSGNYKYQLSLKDNLYLISFNSEKGFQGE
ncbi:hypothetical protein [Pedobacter alpinus]|uniref:Beta-lactamase-inhibitor-like PepSY-like domain-containing protein n=1 Tax=Pedobacter alpinus TaxID=1590643 RepID=A0ABW5TSW4_9SPHI